MFIEGTAYGGSADLNRTAALADVGFRGRSRRQTFEPLCLCDRKL